MSARHTAGRLAAAVLFGVVAWLATLMITAGLALRYDQYLGHRLNVFGRSSPFWPEWRPWWGWYAMHAGAVAVGLLGAAVMWRRSGRREAGR